MAESLTFEIHPEAETLYLEVLLKSIDDVRKLVKDVDFAVTRERRGRPWVVTRLQSSTPTIELRPALDGSEVVDAIADGLSVVTAPEDPREPPRYFSEDVLDDLRGMRRLFRGRYRASKLVVWADRRERGVATIREDIAEKVDRVLRGSYSILGSLEGTLEAVNMRPEPPTFTIWERLSGRPVRCVFHKELWVDRVLEMVKHKTRVLVVGEVRYFRNGTPRFIADIRDLRDMTPDPSLPAGDFGTVPDLTGGQDAVDYLKSMRE